MPHAWSLLSLDEEERQFAGNLGYEDILGSRYVWDSTVPNARAVKQGDLAVLRDNSSVLGLAWIDEIQSIEQRKVRRRCPNCRDTGFKARKHLSPRFKCTHCQTTFDGPAEEAIDVTVYMAEYERTWRATVGVPTSSLKVAYLSNASQHSVRGLDIELVHKLLTEPGDLGPAWWSNFRDEDTNFVLPGGHRRVLGRLRVGQARFREALRVRFGDICAVTGAQPAAALDAAHLYRYCDTGKHDVRGGLLLRRDIHALFDRFMLAIDTSDWTVRLGPQLLRYPELAAWNSARVHVPEHLRPRPEYLDSHLAWAVDEWETRSTQTTQHHT